MVQGKQWYRLNCFYERIIFIILQIGVGRNCIKKRCYPLKGCRIIKSVTFATIMDAKISQHGNNELVQCLQSSYLKAQRQEKQGFWISSSPSPECNARRRFAVYANKTNQQKNSLVGKKHTPTYRECLRHRLARL